MPKFEVTAPDGTVYVGTAPEGMSQEDIDAAVASKLAAMGADRPGTPELAALRPKPRPPEPAIPASEVAVGMVKNAPESAWNMAKDVAQAVAHPIDTASAVISLGRGIMDVFGWGDPSSADAETARAVGQMFLDRYGSVEGIKKSLRDDPVGVLADVSTLVSGGGTAVGKLAPMVGKAATKAGVAGAADVGAAVGRAGETVADVGAAVDPLSMAGKAITTPIAGVGQSVADMAGNAGAQVLGLSTGAGADSIKQVAKAAAAGDATAVKNMRGAVSPYEVVNEAKDALDRLRQARGRNYKAGEGAFRNDPTALNFGKIEARWQNFWDSLRTQSGKLTVGDVEMGKLQEIGNAINDWRDPAHHTADGLDGLKRRIQAVYPDNPKQAQVQRAVTAMTNTIKSEIEAQAPGYAKLMKDYHDASDQIFQIEKTLSLKPTASVDTQMRKLQSIMRNNVNTNYGARGEMVDALEATGKSLRPALAGQSLNSWTPRGLQTLSLPMVASMAAGSGNVGPLALLQFTSPRLMGEAAHLAGKVGGAMSRGTSAIGASPLRQVGRGLYQSGRIQPDEELE